MELYTVEGYRRDSLQHYGLKGMKWGIRRYQNPDGTLTPAGKLRYSDKATYKTKYKRDKRAAKYDTKSLETEAKALRKTRKLADRNGGNKLYKSAAKKMEQDLEKHISESKERVNQLKGYYGDKHVKSLNEQYVRNVSVSRKAQAGRNALKAAAVILGGELVTPLITSVGVYASVASGYAQGKDVKRHISKYEEQAMKELRDAGEKHVDEMLSAKYRG